MVTVVKPQEVKQVKCRKCGSVLEYVFTEIQELTYGGGRDTHRFIVCPACTNEVGVQ
jgi:RNase P subunit RPR2